MPKNPDIKKVLVIGSGPIVIGQAAEFDYAGTQACRSLKEEGLEVVLLNSNPATIMTDKDIADRVYIEPLTVDVVEQLILKEKPDSVLPTLGGQAGLNLAMELDERGFFEKTGVKLIGTTSQTIKKAEDRLEFKATMEKIGEPVAPSLVVENLEDGIAFSNKIGYPVVLRPAYTLGGSGGGIAHNQEELEEILANGLRLSRVGQVLVERCIAGWKEIEYEVMRDGAGNVITVCNMENIDPVGVHTGDSIVVAPSQTLGDKEYQMLRTSALNIISELKITGGCNVQFALHPESFEYSVISKGLGRSYYNTVTGMDADRVNIFHVADGNYIACAVTHYLVLDLFPSCDAALYQNLSYTGETKTICKNLLQFFLIVSDTAAASAQGICRTKNNRITDLIGECNTIFQVLNNQRRSYRLTDLLHGCLELQTVFCLLNGLGSGSDKFYTGLLEESSLIQLHSQVGDLLPVRQEGRRCTVRLFR